MYKLTLSKLHSDKAIQHFSENKLEIDKWREAYLETYPDETVRVFKSEETLLEVHKGVKA